jgi:hypothetical protein
MSNEIVFLLDRSGSMDTQSKDVFGSYKNFKDEHPESIFSLYTFSDDCTNICFKVPMKDAPDLTYDNYTCTGSTSLFDAMGTILCKHAEGTFIILTDGEENSSKTFSKSAIKTMIEFSKMKIVYIGADIEQAKEMGIKEDLTMSYDGRDTPNAMQWASQSA